MFPPLVQQTLLAESYFSNDANKQEKVLVFFLSNLFSLVLLSTSCITIMLKTILFFVFESIFTSLHEVHFLNSLGASSLSLASARDNR